MLGFDPDDDANNTDRGNFNEISQISGIMNTIEHPAGDEKFDLKLDKKLPSSSPKSKNEQGKTQ